MKVGILHLYWCSKCGVVLGVNPRKEWYSIHCDEEMRRIRLDCESGEYYALVDP